MSEKKISPVLQFVLLLSPVVMSGFYLVYSLAGLFLDGRDKYNWALEARDVAVAVGSGIVIYSVLVLLLAKYSKLRRYHLLWLSGWGHLILAVILTIAVFLIV